MRHELLHQVTSILGQTQRITVSRRLRIFGWHTYPADAIDDCGKIGPQPTSSAIVHLVFTIRTAHNLNPLMIEVFVGVIPAYRRRIDRHAAELIVCKMDRKDV